LQYHDENIHKNMTIENTHNIQEMVDMPPSSLGSNAAKELEVGSCYDVACNGSLSSNFKFTTEFLIA
jgi:hypothetical protein